jgi:parallel beta-helix repeat protein
MVQFRKTLKSYNRVVVRRWSFGLGLLLLAASSDAATVCVSQLGTCPYLTIGDAVKAASAGDTIQVQAGIYNESLTVTKSLSLIGAGRDRTIINAFGLANGIFINGVAKAPATGISNVMVSGLTVENATYEGILVVNGSAISITANQVSGNNRGLNSGTCPGLPAFETNENLDCGEGIHLMAVHHSVVANNVVKNNSGGILITDETGPTHDNLITGNNVNNNAYACGITLASHPAATSVGLKLPGGIYRNTISGNTSASNGLQVGGGAGIGIFAPGPGNQNYSNVIVNNILTGNGLPGVTMHNHADVPGAPPVNMNDNMIIGNQISGNAADSADAATPGPTGINIYSVAKVTGTIIAQNVIKNETIGIAINLPSSDVIARLNNIQASTGVDNLGSGPVDASLNYWGCAAGPGQNGCAGVIGLVVASNPSATPF